MAQQPAGIRWLNVHPEYLVSEDDWAVVRLAARWREGQLPESGGVQEQAAWTVNAIEVVTGTWKRMQEAHDAKERS